MPAHAPDNNPFAPPAEHADLRFQNGTYQGRNLASYWQRLAGAMIDALLSAAAATPGILVYHFVLRERWVRSLAGLAERTELVRILLQGLAIIAIGPLILGCYQWWLVTKTGQTLAKRWLGMRIVREGSGELPGFVHGVLLRSWLFIAAGLLPYVGSCASLIDGLAIFFGERRQTLHDRVAGTIVVVA